MVLNGIEIILVLLRFDCFQDGGGGHRHTVEHASGDTQWRGAVWGAGIAQVAVRRLVQRRYTGEQHGGWGRTRVREVAVVLRVLL